MPDTAQDRLRRVAAATLIMLLVSAAAAPAVGAAAKTKRASVKSNGGQSNGTVRFFQALSHNGRFLVFQSSASDLVRNDTNSVDDLFIRDFKRGKTRRISVGSGGTQGDGASGQASISADARFVAFRSFAENLVPGKRNRSADIFVFDRVTKKTKLISQSSTGVRSNSDSNEPNISENGRFVTYYSIAGNLVPNDTNGAITDVFVFDRKKKKTTLVSRATGGLQGNKASYHAEVSGNGRYVVFASDADNLVPNDTNNATDVFVHDRWKKKTRRVSVRSSGAQADGSSFDPSISANGRIVAFTSRATDLHPADPDGNESVYVHDLVTRKTTLVSKDSKGTPAECCSDTATLSADGRYVGFASSDPDLVKGDTNSRRDAFVHDRKTKKTTRVSLRRNGGQSSLGASYPFLSGDGRFIGFQSETGNLVPKDTNGVADAFRRGSLR